MKSFEFKGFDRIAPAIEQAKKAGLIKEPELLKQGNNQKYILYGILISCAVFSSCFLVQSLLEKNIESKVNKA